MDERIAKITGLSPHRKAKNCSLSVTSIEHIQQYAQAHGMNFSRAIEGLALLAIEDKQTEGLIALLQETIRIEVMRQYNRIAKISVQAALEAGSAKEMTQTIYWWVLLQEYEDYLEQLPNPEAANISDFEHRFRVKVDSTAGQILTEQLNRRRDRARYRSVKSLRSGIAELHDILDDLEQWEAGHRPQSEIAEG